MHFLRVIDRNGLKPQEKCTKVKSIATGEINKVQGLMFFAFAICWTVSTG